MSVQRSRMSAASTSVCTRCSLRSQPAHGKVGRLPPEPARRRGRAAVCVDCADLVASANDGRRNRRAGARVLTADQWEATCSLSRASPRLDHPCFRKVADASGFMTGLDEEEVLAAAVATDAVVLMERTPGASLVAGTPRRVPLADRTGAAPGRGEGRTAPASGRRRRQRSVRAHRCTGHHLRTPAAD